jgi:hypothetical protein
MRTRQAVAFLVLAALVVLGCRGARAQGRRASPHERTPVVTVDGSQMFVEYGRPYTRGRTIFGSLIRWDEVWCPGADEATYLSTSLPIRVGSLKLPAGKYSLWIRPAEDVWTLIFNSDWDTFHTNHRSRSDVGKVPMQKDTTPATVEQLTFTIEPNTGAPGGRIAMAWATTKVSVPFVVGD